MNNDGPTQYKATFSHLGENNWGDTAAFFFKKAGGVYSLDIQALPDGGTGLEPNTKYTITRDGWSLLQYHPARDDEYPTRTPTLPPQTHQEAPRQPIAPAPIPGGRVDASCLTGLAKSLVEAKTVATWGELEVWLKAFAAFLREQT